MSHIVIFDEERSWYGANWAGRNLVHQIIEHLPPESTAVAECLQHVDDFPGCNVDLSCLSAHDLRLLQVGAERALAGLTAAGPSSFHDPSFFPGFVRKFEEFIQITKDKIDAVTKNKL